jgi:Tol biopolymer transport system component
LIRPRSWVLSILVAGLMTALTSCGTSTSAVVNPTPAISGLFPPNVTAGTQAFTLNIAGQNFLNGKIANTQGISTVYWNGQLRTSTYNKDTTQLAVSITASDVATAGIAQVTVVNPSPGGGPSPAATFTILPVQPNTPLISSISPTSTNLGNQPVTITVNGSNFQASSVIAFNGAPLCPTWVISPTQLVAQIGPEYLTAASLASISVYTPTGGGGNLYSPGVGFTVGTVTGNNMTFPQVVSVSALGGASDGPSEAPAMSWDGRYVAFYSQAKNLVSEGASGNIFVRDTCLNDASCVPQTTAVDLAPDGAAANGKVGRQVALSGDGRYVAFISRATNLGSGGAATSGFTELYVRDLCTNAGSGCSPHTDLVSVGLDGAASNGPATRPSLSGDGRFVAFESSATNLVSGVAQAQPQVYVRDTCTGATAAKSCVPQTYAVAMDEQDRVAFGQGTRPMISATGRYVAFEAWTGGEAAQAGVPSASESAEVVIADTCLGAEVPAGCHPVSTRASLTSDGATISGSNFSPSISANGRYVAFESQPVNTPAAAGTSGTTTNASRIYVRDTCNGATAGCVPSTAQVAAEMLTAASGRTEVYSPSLSPSGRYVSYLASSPSSGASTEGVIQVRDLCYGAGKSCAARAYAVDDTSNNCSTGCQTATCPPVPSSSIGATADKYTPIPLSANGRFAAFYAPESMPAQPSNGIGDIFMTITPF